MLYDLKSYDIYIIYIYSNPKDPRSVSDGFSHSKVGPPNETAAKLTHRKIRAGWGIQLYILNGCF